MANNVASDLLQADEFSDVVLDLTASDFGENNTEEEKGILRSSHSYRSVVALEHDLGSLEGAISLKEWWAQNVLSRQNSRSVYSVDASYMVQHARLLSDFLREHLEP